MFGNNSQKRLGSFMGMSEQSFNAHGKLMLFGEYVVMRGLPAIAFPIKMGQTLTVSSASEWLWESFELNKRWFTLRFNRKLEILETNNDAVAEKLVSLLGDIKLQHAAIFEEPKHFVVRSNFNRNWGFGSSATLISLLGQWSGVDAYQLNDKHFGGSGYDIAAAIAQGPICYERETRQVRSIDLPKEITDKLLFVYLGKKQNSQLEVAKFSSTSISEAQLSELRECIDRLNFVENIAQFEDVVDKHEALLSVILERSNLKALEFGDYSYSVKSLGAWGGDFFMATCRNSDEARMYFIKRGYEVVFTYDMLKV